MFFSTDLFSNTIRTGLASNTIILVRCRRRTEIALSCSAKIVAPLYARSPPATCTQVVVETGDEATSMYSGIYDALGTAFGKPRFVRVDNKAMLEGTTMNGEEQWILTGLKTTLWVSLFLIDSPSPLLTFY